MTTMHRALALSLMERYLGLVLALGSGMLLARLLTPEQIGMYSVTLAVIGLAHVLREFGVGSYLIQQRALNDDHVRTAFGLALVMGGTLAMVIYAAAPHVARFYSAPSMAGLMRIVALNFLVLPFCSISLSLLRRAMQFKALLYVNLSALGLGTAVTLSLAFAGHGPTSMAVGAVVGNIATGFGAWWARGRPAPLPPGWKEWRTVLNFGGQSAATGIVTTVAMDINDLVVGRLLGFAPVAILSRAQGLMSLFHRDIMAAVRNVAYPAYARIHREGGDIESAHVSNVVMVTVCAWPFYGFLSLFPLEIMRLLFGLQWDAAAALVPVFCLAGALGATSSLAMSTLMAVGRIDLVTKTELIFQPLRATAAVAAAVVFESVIACALAYLLAFAVHPLVAYRVKQLAIPNAFASLFAGLRKSFVVTVLCLCPAFMWAWVADSDQASGLSFFEMITVAMATVMAWLLALCYTRHPLAMDPVFRGLLARIPIVRRVI